MNKRVYRVNLDKPDPRVIRTIRRALKWCELHLSDWRPREVYSSQLVAIMGPEQEGRIGRYLRDTLLIKVDDHLSSALAAQKGMKAHPASYQLNQAGFDELLQRFGPLDEGYADLFREHSTELDLRIPAIVNSKSTRW